METDVNTLNGLKQDEMIFEETVSEQQISKIPRLSKTGLTRKKAISKDGLERPQSAKSIASLENKFKSVMVKYNKECKEFQSQSEKVNNTLDSLSKIREELLEKGQKDLPHLPELPRLPSMPIQGPSNKGYLPGYTDKLKEDKLKLQEDNAKLKERLDELHFKYNSEIGTLEVIKNELHNLTRTYKGFEESMAHAQSKQNKLEGTLNRYKDNFSCIVDNLNDVSSVKKNSERLLYQLQTLQEEFEKERNTLRDEIHIRESTLKELSTTLDIEISKRKELQDILNGINEEKVQLEDQCEKLQEQLEALGKSGSVQDLALENGQLSYELEHLKNSLNSTEARIAAITKENETHKQDIARLAKERTAIKNDFVHHCEQTLFDKENQIYFIKNKMDNIVSLKNSLSSRQDKGEPFFSLDNIMKLSDSNTLKKEVMSLHKRLADAEDKRAKLEVVLSTKDVRVQGLEEELSSTKITLERMENLVQTLKLQEEENARCIATLRQPTKNSLKMGPMEDETDYKMTELVTCQEKQKDMLAGLEMQLKAADERHSLSEERRLRNEERIALLQMELAKYRYCK